MRFVPFISTFLYNVPYYVIWLGGVVYAFVNRKKHPRTSLFAGLALGTLFLNGLLSFTASSYFQYQMMYNGASTAEFGRQLQMLTFFSIPIAMIGWGLLLVAVFGWKGLTEPEVIRDDSQGNSLL